MTRGRFRTRAKHRWFLHPEHGYMLRARTEDPDYDMVVIGLVLSHYSEQRSAEHWEAHKSRLRVNAGSGAVAVELLRADDHNPGYVRVQPYTVPKHIRKDFKEAL